MAPKQNKQTKATPAPAPAPAPVPTLASPVATETVPAEATQTEYDQALTSMFACMSGMAATIKDMQAKLKIVQREANKAMKAKTGKTAKKSTSKREPSGFAKPCKLSKELCTFLGKDEDCLIQRNDATKLIHQYIKENNLQKPEDRRYIIPDEKLKTIVSVPNDVQLSYFNLQTYIKHHFHRVADEGSQKN